jgi:hypothetical protein
VRKSESESLEKLKYKYKYFWLIVSKWPGFHRLLRNHYPQLNNGLALEYKQRLMISAVRGASFIYILSKSVSKKFDPRIALNTGMLSALFDDLIDEEFENFATIQHLITDPGKTNVSSQQGKIAKELYFDLLTKLDDWQKTQLKGVLEKLLEIEKVVKIKRNGEWKKRGMYAFFVYLTIIHIPLCKVDPAVALRYGEYLQLLDDYEDFHADDPLDNYFKINPGFDLNAHYINQIKPILTSIFYFEFNHNFFCEFVETYHIFQTRTFKNNHQEDIYLDQKKRTLVKYMVRKFNGNVPF